MSTVRVCPECRRRLAEGAVLCTGCGHDTRTHKRIASRALDIGAAVSRRGGLVRRLLPWLFGAGLAAALIASVVAALVQPTYTMWYVVMAVTYALAGWTAGVIVDFRTKGLFGALMWFMPFGGKRAMFFGAAAETMSARVRSHGPFLEAVFINALLAVLSPLAFIIAAFL